MRVLGYEALKLLEGTLCDNGFLLEKIDSKSAVVIRLKDLGEGKWFEVLRTDASSSWSFTHRSMNHVFAEKDTLVGLAGFEEVRVERDSEQMLVLARPLIENCIVVVFGSSRLGTLKRFYEVLWERCGFSTKMPKSLLTQKVFNRTTDQQNLFLATSTDEAEVRRLLEEGVQVALRIESGRELDNFYKLGVRCFVLKDFDGEYRERYRDSLFILENGAVARTLGRADGLLIDIEGLSLEEVVLASLLNRLLPLYVPAKSVDPRMLDVLGFGAIDWRRRTNPIFSRIEHKGQRLYQVHYVNEFNMPSLVRIDVSTGSIEWIEGQKKPRLRKQTVHREDGRYFHFYSEGEP